MSNKVLYWDSSTPFLVRWKGARNRYRNNSSMLLLAIRMPLNRANHLAQSRGGVERLVRRCYQKKDAKKAVANSAILSAVLKLMLGRKKELSICLSFLCKGNSCTANFLCHSSDSQTYSYTVESVFECLNFP